MEAAVEAKSEAAEKEVTLDGTDKKTEEKLESQAQVACNGDKPDDAADKVQCQKNA